MLTAALNDPKHSDLRTQALAALGTLGTNARAATLIVSAMKDPDYEVRSSAILAAGQTKNRTLTTDIRNMLNDKEPQVALAAAATLWKMNDYSGEDVLIAVVNGDRKATASLKDSTMHTVNKDVHSPATLARIGALQGASILLGPFGFGITAYEYMRKNGADSARAAAVEQLSQEKTGPVRTTITDALGDKDPAVRAAAAKAIGLNYRDKAATMPCSLSSPTPSHPSASPPQPPTSTPLRHFQLALESNTKLGEHPCPLRLQTRPLTSTSFAASPWPSPAPSRAPTWAIPTSASTTASSQPSPPRRKVAASSNSPPTSNTPSSPNSPPSSSPSTAAGAEWA